MCDGTRMLPWCPLSSGRGCSCSSCAHPSLQLQLTQGHYPPSSATLRGSLSLASVRGWQRFEGFVLRRRGPVGTRGCWPHLLGPPPAVAQARVCTDARADTTGCWHPLCPLWGPNPVLANSAEEGGGLALLGRAGRAGERVAPAKAEASPSVCGEVPPCQRKLLPLFC